MASISTPEKVYAFSRTAHSKIQTGICTHLYPHTFSYFVFNHVCCVYMSLYVAYMNKLQIVLLSPTLDTTAMCSVISRVL